MRGRYSELWRYFRRDKIASTGLLILVVLIFVAIIGKVCTEWIVVFDPAEVRLMDKLLPPFFQCIRKLTRHTKTRSRYLSARH